MSREKMTCPECGVEMNCHAEKIEYNVPEEKARLIDPDFGGILQEAHSCPECGKTLMREAPTA